jgi:hypothetical protein
MRLFLKCSKCWSVGGQGRPECLPIANIVDKECHFLSLEILMSFWLSHRDFLLHSASLKTQMHASICGIGKSDGVWLTVNLYCEYRCNIFCHCLLSWR